MNYSQQIQMDRIESIMQTFQISRMTNEPTRYPKRSEEISTLVCDPNSSEIKPCTFCHFDQNQLQQMDGDKLNEHPQATMLDKIMAAIQVQNTNIGATEALINAVLQLSETIEFLKKQVRGLQSKVSKIGLNRKETESKRKRRRAVELEKNYICPDPSCLKSYASDISLNLHIRLKHKSTEAEVENHPKTPFVYPLESTQSKFQLPPIILRGVQSEYSRLLQQNHQEQ